MTIEQSLYGPGWLTCAKCNVTQPSNNLVTVHSGDPRKPATLQCLDEPRCARYAKANKKHSSNGVHK